jgi:hypothetical protein
MITREAVMLFKNSNAFIQNIDTQYDSMFARDGAKIGTSVRIRLPNDYTVRDGAAASIQDTAEQSTTLNLSTQRGVDVGFTSAERTMSLDDYAERVLQPMMNNLVGNVAKTIMAGSEGGVSNFVSNVDGAGNIINASQDQYLQANAILSDNSASMGNRKIVLDPTSNARAASALTGLLNPASEISEQFRSGQMKSGLGYRRWFEDQTVIKHTAGTFTAGTVNGAAQTGTTLVVNAITGTLKKGDIITIAGVNAVNRVNKQDLGTVRQFVVTADVANAAVSIPIYPAIIAQIGGADVQYQTVLASPANAAAITLVSPAGATYRKSIAFTREAVTMATADLVLPSKGIVEGARSNYDGISLRMITYFNGGTDVLATRMDVLFGFLYIRPEWLCVVADRV